MKELQEEDRAKGELLLLGGVDYDEAAGGKTKKKSRRHSGESEVIKGVAAENNTVKFEYDTVAQGLELTIKMTMDFTETKMDGIMTAGSFGTFPVTGKRK